MLEPNIPAPVEVGTVPPLVLPDEPNSPRDPVLIDDIDAGVLVVCFGSVVFLAVFEDEV